MYSLKKLICYNIRVNSTERTTHPKYLFSMYSSKRFMIKVQVGWTLVVDKLREKAEEATRTAKPINSTD